MKVHQRNLFVAIVALACVHSITGFSAGAPQQACQSLEPVGHSGAQRNPTQNPFSLSAPTQAKSAQTVTVTLTTQPGQEFKGYMIQAVTPNGEIVGQFQSKSLQCNAPKDTATHSNPNKEFMSSANMTYQVPVMEGTVYFRGTVVRTYSEYFINIYSNPMTIS